MRSAPKSGFVDADPVLEWEGNTVGAEVAGHHGSTGVIAQGMRARVRQEPGRPHYLRSEQAGLGSREIKTQAHRG